MSKEYVISDQEILLRLAKNARKFIELKSVDSIGNISRKTKDSVFVLNSGVGINDSFKAKNAFKGSSFQIVIALQLDGKKIRDKWVNKTTRDFDYCCDEAFDAIKKMQEILSDYVIKFAGGASNTKITDENTYCALAYDQDQIDISKLFSIGRHNTIKVMSYTQSYFKLKDIESNVIIKSFDKAISAKSGNSGEDIELMPVALILQLQYTIGKEEK